MPGDGASGDIVTDNSKKHPVMVAGIIVAAAGDEKILSFPSSHASTASAWMILGGPALFVAGHAAFKYVVWRHVSWNRLAGIAVLGMLAATVPVIPEVALAACAAVVVAAIAAMDRVGTARLLRRPGKSPFRGEMRWTGPRCLGYSQYD